MERFKIVVLKSDDNHSRRLFARRVFGRKMAIQKNRGRIVRLGNGPQALITVHPSFLLRLPDEAARQSEYTRFVADLALVAGYAG